MSKTYLVEKTIVIRSESENIFAVLTEVKHWNEWAKSIIDVSFVGKENF